MENTEKNEDENTTNAYNNVVGFIKGVKSYYLHQGKNYIMKFGPNTKLNVVNKVAKDSIIRLDKAHLGHHEFNHINLNPKYSKITKTTISSTGKVKVQPHDPHIKLPPGSLTAGTYAGKLCKAVNAINEVLFPIVVTVDVIRISNACLKDYTNGSTRNTVEKTAELASIWSTSFAGAWFGSAVGSGIVPGIGTIIGGIMGGVAGGITGTHASKYVCQIGDAMEYDIVKSNCECCGREFKAKKYQGEINCKNHPTFFEASNTSLINKDSIIQKFNVVKNNLLKSKTFKAKL